MSDYPRPQNVRIRRANGQIIRVELAWRGIDDDGIGVWEIAPFDHHTGDALLVGVFPARTRIRWQISQHDNEIRRLDE